MVTLGDLRLEYKYEIEIFLTKGGGGGGYQINYNRRSKP